MLVDDRVLAERAARVDALLAEVDALPDPELRDRTLEIVEGLLGLYGAGLERIMAIVAEQDSGALLALTEDDLVEHLLLLHDLHPIALEARVARALDEVRPYLQSHGGDVELLEIEESAVRLRLQGSCHGCPSSTATLKLAIEEAIHKAAPEVERIEAEGATAPQPVNFVSTSELLQPRVPRWFSAGTVGELAGGGVAIRDVGGVSIAMVDLGGTLYAYHSTCPSCGQSVAAEVLTGDALTCTGCGRRYELRHVGRCQDAESPPLPPVPLLVRDGTVRVAVGDV